MFGLNIWGKDRRYMGLRMFLGGGLGLGLGATVFGYIATRPVIWTEPMELAGYLVYIKDINISNRIFAVISFLMVSVTVFVLFARCSCSLQLSSKFYAAAGFFHDTLICLKRDFNNFIGAVCGLGGADSRLAAERRLNGKWLFGGSFVAACVPSGLLAATQTAVAYWRPDYLYGFIGWVKVVCLALHPFFFIILFYCWGRSPGVWLPRLVMALQAGLLSFYFILIPIPLKNEWGTLTQLVSLKRISLVILAAILWGLYDIVGKRKNNRSIFSAVALFGLFIGFTTHAVVPTFWANHAEIGHRIAPAWMVINGWTELFNPSFLPYALNDLLSILTGWTMAGEETMITASLGFVWFNLLLCGVAFGFVQRIVPPLLAFVLIYLTAYNSAGSLLIVIYAAILLQPELRDRHGCWLVVWAVISACWPFMRLSNGAICVLGSLPGALFHFIQLYKGNKRACAQFLLFLLALAFIVVVYPFGGNFYGLIQNLLELSKVNTHWAANESAPWTWTLVHVHGLVIFFVPPLVLISAVYYIKMSNPQRSASMIFFVWFVAISIVCLAGYSFSRLDGSHHNRQWFVAKTMLVVIVLGIWAFCRAGTARNILSGICLGAVFFVLPTSLINKPALYLWGPGKNPFTNGLVNIHFQNGTDFGLPKMGIGNFPSWVDNYLGVAGAARQTLDNLLDPGELYFDLTFHGEYYFLFERGFYGETPAYWHYAGDAQQHRAVDMIKERNIRVFLLDSTFYEAPFSLRTFYLYRYAVLNGLPLEAYGTSSKRIIIMPEADFVRKGLKLPSPEKVRRIYDQMFYINDYKHLPAVWGRGYEKFKKNLELLKPMPIEQIGGQAEYRFTRPFQGRRGGLLAVGLQLDGHSAQQPLVVQWDNADWPGEANCLRFTAHDGWNIIPLDSLPRWLLAENIVSLSIRSDDGRAFTISQAELYGR